jgi:hypothetical protein
MLSSTTKTRNGRAAEAHAQAAVRAGERAVRLHERLEDAVEHVGRHADSRVAHPDHGLVALPGRRHLDVAARHGVFGGVVEEVRDHLLEPGGVGLQADGLGGRIDRQLVGTALDQGADPFDGALEDGAQVHDLLPQADAAAGDAGDVEQVVHQPGEVLDLALHHLARGLEGGVDRLDLAHQLDGVADGGERVAQLVGQHGEELVLAAVGSQELLGAPAQLLLQPLLLGDVELRAPAAHETAAFDHAHEVVQEDLGIALGVHLVGLGTGQPVAGLDEGAQILDVVGVLPGKELAQAGAQDLLLGVEPVHAGHDAVALGEHAMPEEAVDLLVLGEAGRDGLLELEAPDPLRALLDESPVTLLALAQGSLSQTAFRGVAQHEHGPGIVRQRLHGLLDPRLVETGQNVLERAAARGIQTGAGQALGGGVHERYAALYIRGDDGVTDLVQRNTEPIAMDLASGI